MGFPFISAIVLCKDFLQAVLQEQLLYLHDLLLLLPTASLSCLGIYIRIYLMLHKGRYLGGKCASG